MLHVLHYFYNYIYRILEFFTCNFTKFNAIIYNIRRCSGIISNFHLIILTIVNLNIM